VREIQTVPIDPGRRATTTPAISSLDRYDAFISYDHDAESDLVKTLHTELERFGKPWWKARELRVFRDRTTMPASADLWATVVEAMRMSNRLILVASSHVARSSWVEAEIHWWLKNKSRDSIIIVLVEGALTWSPNERRWDAAATTALPPALLQAYGAEPFWIDLTAGRRDRETLTDAVATISSAITGIPKDRTLGRHVLQQRRTRRHVGIAGTAGVGLIAAALVTAILLGQQTAATAAGQLAAASTQHLATDLGLAQLLAVEAYRTEDNPQTRAALFRAVDATPQVTRYLPAGGTVQALAVAASGVIVAGTEEGDVQRWKDGKRETIAHIADGVRWVGVSDDGAVVSASGGSGAVLWNAGKLHAIDVPDTYKPGPTAVAPSGRSAMFHATSTLETRFADGADNIPGTLITVDVPTSTARTADADGYWSAMSAIGDDEISLSGENGDWQRRIGDAIAVRGSTNTGNYYQGWTLLPDGRYFSFSNGSEEIPVWDARGGEVDDERPERSVRVPGANRQSLAISPSGQTMAVADTGTVYLAPISASSGSSSAAVRLDGNSYLTNLRFIDEQHLVAAADDMIVMWDLTRQNRLGQALSGDQFDVPWPCRACRGVTISTRPDGGAAAVVGGWSKALVLALDTAWPAARPLNLAEPLTAYTDAIWTSDGSYLVLSVHDQSVDQSGGLVAGSTGHLHSYVRGDAHARRAGPGHRPAVLPDPGSQTLDRVPRPAQGAAGPLAGREALPGLRQLLPAPPRPCPRLVRRQPGGVGVPADLRVAVELDRGRVRRAALLRPQRHRSPQPRGTERRDRCLRALAQRPRPAEGQLRGRSPIRAWTSYPSKAA
jgi:hypothetical protein